jgi:hypothetical protein
MHPAMTGSIVKSEVEREMWEMRNNGSDDDKARADNARMQCEKEDNARPLAAEEMARSLFVLHQQKTNNNKSIEPSCHIHRIPSIN